MHPTHADTEFTILLGQMRWHFKGGKISEGIFNLIPSPKQPKRNHNLTLSKASPPK